jgi:hypothetical protein
MKNKSHKNKILKKKQYYCKIKVLKYRKLIKFSKFNSPL